MRPSTINRAILSVTFLLLVGGACIRSGRDLGNVAPNNQQARDIAGDQAAVKANADVEAAVEAALAKLGPTSKQSTTTQTASADNGGIAAPQTTDTDTTQAGVVNTAITVAGGGVGAICTLGLWLRHTRRNSEHAREQQTVRMLMLVMVIMAILRAQREEPIDG